MEIYGEFLFAENALTGAVILLLTGKLCGYSVPAGRIITGSIMCGTYAFILFVRLHWLAALLSKILFSAAVVLLVFRPPALRGGCKAVAVFFIVSMLMGGITVSLMYMTGAQGMAGNGSIYFYGIRYLQIMCGVILTFAVGTWLAGHLVEKVIQEAVITDVEICIAGYRLELKAFIDTGNFLKEPVSGYPAVLVSARTGTKIKENLGAGQERRFCLIPYRTVNGSGMLHGLRPDWITIGEKQVSKVVLAISGSDFAPWKGIEEYDVLLHQQLVEGRTDDVQGFGDEKEPVGEIQGISQA